MGQEPGPCFGARDGIHRSRPRLQRLFVCALQTGFLATLGCDRLLGANFDVAASAPSSTSEINAMKPPDVSPDVVAGVVSSSACAERGERMCQGAAQQDRLTCDGENWQVEQPCAQDENCSRASGLCAPIIEACRGEEPNHRFCSGDELHRCGPDLVTEEKLESCAGRCTGAREARCDAPRCGDGKRTDGEECDDLNLDDSDACPSNCRRARCGDGFVFNGHERCDDANASSADGCSPTCELEVLQVAPGSHVCAVLRGGTVKCWGLNYHGALGVGDVADRGDQPNELGEHLPAVDLGHAAPAQAVATTSFRSCALLVDGRVKCWGGNQYGALGLGDVSVRGDDPSRLGDQLPYVDLGTGVTATALALGLDHSCALLADGSVKCWGKDESTGPDYLYDVVEPIRGDDPNEMGDNLPRIDLGSGLRATAIAAGAWHTCAILEDGAVKCWGFNEYGQLGQGDGPSRSREDPSAMGDHLPLVELGAGRKALAIGGGFYHTCALLDDGTIKCWGWGAWGESTLGGSTPAEMEPVDLGSAHRAVALSVGMDHNCALLDDHSLRCWGGNSRGQLGLGDTDNRGDDPGELGDALAPVNLGIGVTVKAIYAGHQMTCAVLSDESLTCWGGGPGGNLGFGNEEARGDQPGELGARTPRVPL